MDDHKELYRLILELSHPNCWTSDIIEETGVGILGHGCIVNGKSAFERCTIYGDSRSHVEDAIKIARESSKNYDVIRVGESPVRSMMPESAVGKYAQDVFVHYPLSTVIGPALFSRGFVLNGRSQIEKQVETWPLLTFTTRRTIREKIDGIRDLHNASIRIKQLSPADVGPAIPSFDDRLEVLSPRQEEVFNTARDHGYYDWPRGTSATELAEKLNISKPTLLEHLRTAEAILLNPADHF